MCLVGFVLYGIELNIMCIDDAGAAEGAGCGSRRREQ